MEITEVKIFSRELDDKKLKAFATITFDNCFVVRNIKIIEGSKGLFVAMPSRKIKEPCPKCGFKNPARNKYCGQCAAALPPAKIVDDIEDKIHKQSDHRDIAHPITAECRDKIQKKILTAYKSETTSHAPDRKAAQPIRGTEPFDTSDIDLG
ncbi:MAG: septation protein SpoVG family protein [Candidatus Omnitrophica bacterium]|jgi:stage V sporulation protein G|nr:septation protein SpoVG family protein [Candidatus Omnitrophota bacterium]